MEVAFVQSRDLSEVTCQCRKNGHYAKTCPEKAVKQGHVHTQVIELDVEDEEGDKLGYLYLQNLPDLDWSTCLLMIAKVVSTFLIMPACSQRSTM